MARDTKSLMNSLEIRYKFKLKGKGLLEFHLRCDFFCDRDGVIYFEPHIYFGNMVHTYMTMFGSKPKVNKAVIDPLEQGDIPDLDTSELLDNEGNHKYQYLGIFCICTHVITMSRFIFAPL